MRFIDPDGMKADDHFFDSKGEYLGSTEIGNDIRIVNEGATFEEAATDPSSSMLLTEKNYSKNNVSNVQILSKIATYYANKVGIDQKIEVGYPGKAGGFAYTELQSDQIFMMVDDNGKINEKASDANNLMNSLEHEDGHVKDHSTAKPLAHAMLSVKQMGFDSFKGTTQAFKAVVPSYIMTNLNEAIDKGITLDKVQNVIDLANKYTPQTGYELFINEQTHKVEQIGVLGSIEIIGKKN
jgi:hypothetical protein